MIRRAPVLVMLVTLLAIAGTPAVGAPESVSRLFVAERTTDGPARLVVGGGFGYGGFDGPSDGLVALAGVRDDGDGEIAAADFGTILSSGDALTPYAYADGERIDCGTAGLHTDSCDLFIHGGATATTVAMEDDGGQDAYTRFFVAVHGQGASASLGSGTAGWTLREVAPTFSFVRAEESQAVGVRGNLTGGAEVFLSTTGEGGEFGSVAVGQPPCSYPMFYPGAGVTQLLGGETEPLHACPADFWGVADFATDAAAWSLEGAAAGASVFHDIVRLVVIDLPDPCDEDPQGCEDR